MAKICGGAGSAQTKLDIKNLDLAPLPQFSQVATNSWVWIPLEKFQSLWTREFRIANEAGLGPNMQSYPTLWNPIFEALKFPRRHVPPKRSTVLIKSMLFHASETASINLVATFHMKSFVVNNCANTAFLSGRILRLPLVFLTFLVLGSFRTFKMMN